MTSSEPIIDQVRQARQEIVKQFHGDLKALGAYLIERQRQSGRRCITLPPKRASESTTSYRDH